MKKPYERRLVCTNPYWAGVCSIPDELVEVAADVLPDEIAAVLALTPHVDEHTPWQEREAEAKALNTAAAAGLSAPWQFFVEKCINYEPDGDVLWA